ncbi:MAG: hypothetical protein ACKUBY_06100 [Candidatus Moraniibacteriota bacterium]|jgi:peroxiredoxin family protein
MKKYKIISVSILICSSIMLYGCGDSGEMTTLEFSDIKASYDVKGMIDTPRAVMEVLKNENKININELEDVEGEVNSNMMIYVTEYPDRWDVLVKTRTAIPSYSCEYSMDMFGKPVQDDYVVKKCSFNK